MTLTARTGDILAGDIADIAAALDHVPADTVLLCAVGEVFQVKRVDTSIAGPDTGRAWFALGYGDRVFSSTEVATWGPLRVLYRPDEVFPVLLPGEFPEVAIIDHVEHRITLDGVRVPWHLAEAGPRRVDATPNNPAVLWLPVLVGRIDEVGPPAPNVSRETSAPPSLINIRTVDLGTRVVAWHRGVGENTITDGPHYVGAFIAVLDSTPDSAVPVAVLDVDDEAVHLAIDEYAFQLAPASA